MDANLGFFSYVYLTVFYIVLLGSIIASCIILSLAITTTIMQLTTGLATRVRNELERVDGDVRQVRLGRLEALVTWGIFFYVSYLLIFGGFLKQELERFLED
jgi:hypothetical protein